MWKLYELRGAQWSTCLHDFLCPRPEMTRVNGKSTCMHLRKDLALTLFLKHELGGRGDRPTYNSKAFPQSQKILESCTCFNHRHKLGCYYDKQQGELSHFNQFSDVNSQVCPQLATGLLAKWQARFNRAGQVRTWTKKAGGYLHTLLNSKDLRTKQCIIKVITTLLILTLQHASSSTHPIIILF